MKNVLQRIKRARWISFLLIEIMRQRKEIFAEKKKQQLFEMRLEESEKQIEELQKMAFTDPLTGLLNRRGFMKALHRQTSLLKRYTRDNDISLNNPFIITMDLDHFKKVNDTEGHLKGDEVIRVVAEILNGVFHRETDVVSRTGGDEFIIFCANATEAQATLCAMLLRKRIETDERLHFEHCSVTVSIGVSEMHIHRDMKPHEIDEAFAKTSEEVDQALYHSKVVGGRNAITHSSSMGKLYCL